ncbi:hypothetical protein LEP1GSC127_0250 [Leptospira kirschneri str. 200801925]|nr:hypothetical protein LEP1GSC127_0250 [Leptospira kirschneri str. 200801925]
MKKFTFYLWNMKVEKTQGLTSTHNLTHKLKRFRIKIELS